MDRVEFFKTCSACNVLISLDLLEKLDVEDSQAPVGLGIASPTQSLEQAKIDEVIKLLKTSDPMVKSLIFSQVTQPSCEGRADKRLVDFALDPHRCRSCARWDSDTPVCHVSRPRFLHSSLIIDLMVRCQSSSVARSSRRLRRQPPSPTSRPPRPIIAIAPRRRDRPWSCSSRSGYISLSGG